MREHFDTLFKTGEDMTFALQAADVQPRNRDAYRHHRLVVNQGRPGVVIIAESERGTLLVKSYRPSFGADIWELPRGNSDVGDGQLGASMSEDSLIQAARRELAEETGFTAQECHYLGAYVTDSSVFPQQVGVIRCAVDLTLDPSPRDGEILELRWMKQEELDLAIQNGLVHDAHTLAALAVAAHHH